MLLVSRMEKDKAIVLQATAELEGLLFFFRNEPLEIRYVPRKDANSPFWVLDIESFVEICHFDPCATEKRQKTSIGVNL